MFAFRLALHWLAPFAATAALAWSLFVQAALTRPGRRVLREDDLSDWLLVDIGLKDGPDMAARRMGRAADRVRYR